MLLDRPPPDPAETSQSRAAVHRFPSPGFFR